MKRPIRVLVATGSPAVHEMLVRFLSGTPGISVVGKAVDAAEAVELSASLSPDVITMDVLIPRLDGAIQTIMAGTPSRILVVSSATDDRELELSFRAIENGALEVIPKPSADPPEDPRAWGQRVVTAVRLMVEVPVVRRRTSDLPALSPRHAWPYAVHSISSSRRLDAFGIVASTGGPPAVARILAALSVDFPTSVLVAQHIAAGCAEGFARWLATTSPLPVVIAKPSMPTHPGHVYLAPDGHDLEVELDGRTRVLPSSGGPCPSGDRLLASLALSYGPRAGGVVLTGMGTDGMRGLLLLKRMGGSTFAQNEATSAVFGMPRAALESGGATFSAPLDEISKIIRSSCEAASSAPVRLGMAFD